MAYEVRKTDGSLLTTVEDGTKNDTSTSITLIGKRYADYGKAYNENQLHLLENFANNTPPTAPMPGQIWFDNTAGINTLKVYINDTLGWRVLLYSADLTDSIINNNVAFNGTTTYTDLATFDSEVVFNDTTTFNSIIDLTGAEVQGSYNVTGEPTFTSTVIFDGNVVFNSTFTFATATTFDDDVTIVQDLSVNGSTTLDNGTVTNDFTTDRLISDSIVLPEQGTPESLVANSAHLYAYDETGNDANTVLNLRFLDVDGSTTIEDSANGVVANGGANPDNTITAEGSAAISTYITKYTSGGSINLDGVDSYVSISDSTNFDFSSALEFTIDAWIYLKTGSTEQVIMSKGTATDDTWEIYVDGSDQLVFDFNDGSNTINLSGGRVETYRWMHVAFERTYTAPNATYHLYLDGQRVDSTTVTAATYDFDSITGGISIGKHEYGQLTVSQDETNYDGTGSNGTFAAGSGYAGSDTITLSDGSVITVDAISAGAVTQFTVTSVGPGFLDTLPTLTQSSSSGGGTGFTLTPGVANAIFNYMTGNVTHCRVVIGSKYDRGFMPRLSEPSDDTIIAFVDDVGFRYRLVKENLGW